MATRKPLSKAKTKFLEGIENARLPSERSYWLMSESRKVWCLELEKKGYLERQGEPGTMLRFDITDKGKAYLRDEGIESPAGRRLRERRERREAKAAEAKRISKRDQEVMAALGEVQ